MFTGTFAAMCNMSTKALYIIEKDKGNPTISTISTISTIEAILRNFGLRLALTMTATTTHTASLGQYNLVSKTPARGSNPQRTYAGQLSKANTRRAAAKTKLKDGDKGQAE